MTWQNRGKSPSQVSSEAIGIHEQSKATTTGTDALESGSQARGT